MNKPIQGCLPYAGLALAGVLIWPLFAGAIVIKLGLAVWILGFGMVSIAKFRMGLESREKYDLQALKRVHEREELHATEVPSVPNDATEAFCINCGATYDSRLPICPLCKRPQ